MKITFLGAAGTVTGSMYYIEHDAYKALIDCGQFQGSAEEEVLNAATFPFEPKELDFIILTHAHIDHTGRLPLLVKRGFKGKVYCTYPTMDLVRILLKDSGKIHEADALWENKKRERAGLPKIEPLYTADDGIFAAQYLYPLPYQHEHVLGDSFTFKFIDAAHLLGSSSVILNYQISGNTKTLTFSGDLGSTTNPLLKSVEYASSSDYVVMESTYGDKNHEGVSVRIQKLVDVILEAYESGGTAIIPSFAVGRTQALVYELKKYIETAPIEIQNRLRKIPIYVDSPLSIEAFDIYKSHMASMSESLPEDAFHLDQLHFIKTIEASIAINRNPSPKLIISASGMCDSGRIRHHLKHYLWRDTTHLIFIGYQADESTGRAIQEGIPSIRILGENIAVKAKIHTIDGFSGHADQTQLLNWRKHIQGVSKVFITHGEPAVADAFAEKLLEAGETAEVIIPAADTIFDLN